MSAEKQAHVITLAVNYSVNINSVGGKAVKSHIVFVDNISVAAVQIVFKIQGSTHHRLLGKHICFVENTVYGAVRCNGVFEDI